MTGRDDKWLMIRRVLINNWPLFGCRIEFTLMPDGQLRREETSEDAIGTT